MQICLNVTSITDSSLKGGILIDSGASAHICSDKNSFISWDKYNVGDTSIVLANNETLDDAIQGKGIILLQLLTTTNNILELGHWSCNMALTNLVH